MAAALATVQVDNKTNESCDDDDDEYGYDNDPEEPLRAVGQSMTIILSISANYTNWEPREAFRELVQNWYAFSFSLTALRISPSPLVSCCLTSLAWCSSRRDGIIKSFNLSEKAFRVDRIESSSGRSTEIVYKVPDAGARDDEERWLGYIHFKGRDGEGTVDIVNCSATLQPWHLNMGGTSKAGDAHQAGAHGEGLKVALLVLMRGRQNHCVRCHSGGFNWTFNFTTCGRLVARLRRMSPGSIFRTEMQAQRLTKRTLLPFAARPDGDVQFVIGEERRGRNERGESIKRSLVKLEQFDAWTKAALFLHSAGEGAIIETPAAGDMLIAPQLRGQLYLKGLLLQESTAWRSASMTGRPLRFGYNFSSGKTNRERMSVASAEEEAQAIFGIWDAVLDGRPDMVTQLSDMLNTTEPQYADVVGAKKYMTMKMASLLKEHLIGGKFKNNWYYCNEEKSKV